MDYHLKQWRNQDQSSAKIPRLFEPLEPPSTPPLSLFVPEPCSLSAIPDSTPSGFPSMRGFFSFSQWQELELQALIFKYMLAGATIPAELLQPIKKSFLNTSESYLHHSRYQHYQPAAMLQSGYWGKGVVDPEPGRCRRTDGKKWRCSRDVMTGYKYCERHMNRGRNRSRKPVEIPTTTPSMAGGTHFTISDSSSSVNLLHLNQRSSECKIGNGVLVETHHERIPNDDKQDGQILRHFFDDWPSSNHDTNYIGMNPNSTTSTTCIENTTSDFALKLSTGNGDESGSRESDMEVEQPQLNWVSGWMTQPVSSMGGPLAEALRSSTSDSSPTSVLHEVARGAGSDSVST